MSPKLQDTPLEGVRIEVVDETTFAPVETGIHVLYAFFEAASDEEAFFARTSAMDRLAGTDRLRKMMLDGATATEVIASWQDEVDAFRQNRESYLRY